MLSFLVALSLSLARWGQWPASQQSISRSSTSLGSDESELVSSFATRDFAADLEAFFVLLLRRVLVFDFLCNFDVEDEDEFEEAEEGGAVPTWKLLWG